MTACKTGCGRTATENECRLCEPCNHLWWKSEEYRRWDLDAPNAERMRLLALVDFCDRIRAENQNKSKEAPCT